MHTELKSECKSYTQLAYMHVRVHLFFIMEHFKHWKVEHFVTNPYLNMSINQHQEEPFVANFVSFRLSPPTFPLSSFYQIILK